MAGPGAAIRTTSNRQTTEARSGALQPRISIWINPAALEAAYHYLGNQRTEFNWCMAEFENALKQVGQHVASPESETSPARHRRGPARGKTARAQGRKTQTKQKVMTAGA